MTCNAGFFLAVFQGAAFATMQPMENLLDGDAPRGHERPRRVPDESDAGLHLLSAQAPSTWSLGGALCYGGHLQKAHESRAMTVKRGSVMSSLLAYFLEVD